MLVLVFLLALTSPSLSVSPRFASEPATLVATAKSFSGSVVCVEIDSPEYYTESCQDREGRSNLQFRFANVPAGAHLLLARDATRRSSTVEVIVTKAGPE